MRRWLRLRWLVAFAVLLLAGCGGGGDSDTVIIIDPDPPAVREPGLVGIEDHPAVEITAPQLSVEYALPGVPGTFTAVLLSDQPTDGDIAFDPILGSATITHGPDTLFFGVDSADPNRPEYRAFLDFPLDGSTGQAVIPLDAVILSATLTVFVDVVDFADVVPVRLELVTYSPTSGLAPGDFDSAPLADRSFDIFGADAGRDVPIDVGMLMATAQFHTLADFQVRFRLGP